ncbi:citrate/2-methylcitrate synthase [Halobacillus litoralis]|uniref:citrate/2-methylcitrate synthase n=1 Tax=Halobacillus litoralis TaxID=45668 RepID=UPI0021E59FFB|nr:citrate/2-methylcitrate synthase [Halobacillus litoralis]
MGFGHRVYKTADPRAEALKEQLLQITPWPAWVDQAVQVEKETVEYLNEIKPGRSLYANVEFYAAALMKAIDLPSELFTPIFCCSRMVGWTAHMVEQSSDNVIFRPNAKYVSS